MSKKRDVERHEISLIILDRMRPNGRCCSGADYRSEGHDVNPPCDSVILSRAIAEAILLAGYRRVRVD